MVSHLPCGLSRPAPPGPTARHPSETPERDVEYTDQPEAPETLETRSHREEIDRRRTFGIISHPDAGKTTLTERLLLLGGAIRMADIEAAGAAAPTRVPVTVKTPADPARDPDGPTYTTIGTRALSMCLTMSRVLSSSWRVQGASCSATSASSPPPDSPAQSRSRAQKIRGPGSASACCRARARAVRR